MCTAPKGFSYDKDAPNYWQRAVNRFWEETGLDTDVADLVDILEFFDEYREGGRVMEQYKEAFRLLYEAYKREESGDFVGEFLDEFSAPVDGKFPDFETWWVSIDNE